MNYFDIVTGIILLLAAIKGFKDGFVIELASLAALILGILGAVRFSTLTADFLSRFFTSQHLNIIAFCVTFVLVVIVVHLLARAIDRLIKAVALGWFNRLLGIIFGIVKASLILSVLLLALDVFGLEQVLIPKETQAQSFLFQPLKEAAPRTLELFKTDINTLLSPREETQAPITTYNADKI